MQALFGVTSGYLKYKTVRRHNLKLSEIATARQHYNQPAKEKGEFKSLTKYMFILRKFKIRVTETLAVSCLDDQYKYKEIKQAGRQRFGTVLNISK